MSRPMLPAGISEEEWKTGIKRPRKRSHKFEWQTIPWPAALNRSPDCQQLCIYCGLDARCAFGDEKWCKVGAN